ncbi:ATP-dependent DNA ligase [Chitinasiproducens palmae]|uniref:DNA ligase (ATP) n=1 Tax=Chitinasiproducens palmae TaxID=1770053 RepID=A0A1H2PQK1_9BURK|nr:ATP-dependent DNA ligase [Chitinasiproducens palmae]SDV49105.1 DNA ligase-1 [Chitinasiproducens palmae]
MRAFAALYTTLDATTSTLAKQAALTAYFRAAAPADAAWAAYFLAGGKPRQILPTRLMRELACRLARLPDWLFEESYQAVGDLAETIAHILPPPSHLSDMGLACWMETRLLPLRGAPTELIETRLTEFWDELDWGGRFLLNKLIGGSFRVGVSRQSVVRALAALSGQDPRRIAQRIVGFTDTRRAPSAERYLRLIAAGEDGQDVVHGDDIGLPYPFFLAHQLEGSPSVLGPRSGWQAEWKWDGIRAQLVKRAGRVWLWSRGEDLITERFPEIQAIGEALPDGTVLDGEIVAWDAATTAPQPFAKLQPRITRKTLTRKILDEAPAKLIAYDLLEAASRDLRSEPQRVRRQQLEQLVEMLSHPALLTSPLLDGDDWPALAALRTESRARGVEGLMLKALGAHYGVGRTKAVGEWWKWKIDPYTVDAVLIYAQRGHGRRASLYTDYTFAVWDRAVGAAGERQLVPFAKAYSGLTDAEIRDVDALIRKTTIEKFGPVRSVIPTLVFELAFEAIQASPRHKSGIAVRFPRILRWRVDKPLDEADTIDTLRALLHAAP